MPPKPIDLLAPDKAEHADELSIGHGYIPVVGQNDCQFPSDAFQDVLLNLVRNPNITSSHLFRADILYDSEVTPEQDISFAARNEVKRAEDAEPVPAFQGFEVTRTIIRRLIPRNHQLDKPLDQTCTFLRSSAVDGREKSLVVYTPHVSLVEEMPWYHPAVKALAYLYDWRPAGKGEGGENASSASSPQGTGSMVIHYLLFPSQNLPLPTRLQRMALILSSTIYKHGQGRMTGYSKKFHHDLLLPQAKVQDTYSELKRKYAKRLCDAWVESTEPSKHVFEDLAIAAYLIELWKTMYRMPAEHSAGSSKLETKSDDHLVEFPGFVDIGCGNGVLTEILLCEGFPGWGFDARRRKTWSVLSPYTKSRLRELILIPQPLLDREPVLLPAQASIPALQENSSIQVGKGLSSAFSTITSLFSNNSDSSAPPATQVAASPANLDASRWHNGLFPAGTFVISNHADELTAWTPLLASLSRSAFLAIPCCSHNLAGLRFRAPSAVTGFIADASAPQYFAREKMAASKKKHIAIQVPTSEEMEEFQAADAELPTVGRSKAKDGPETGDLKCLSQANRSKQPSAYQSLCDWVASLADEIGYEVEKDLLRIPSTRNVGIVGRKWSDGAWVTSSDMTGQDQATDERSIDPERWATLMEILRRESPDDRTWIERATKLMSGKDTGQSVHG